MRNGNMLQMERLGATILAHKWKNVDVTIYLLMHRLHNNLRTFAFPHAVLPSELLVSLNAVAMEKEKPQRSSELVGYNSPICPAICGHPVGFHDLKRPCKLILLKTDDKQPKQS